jgi:hypothetical protein
MKTNAKQKKTKESRKAQQSSNQNLRTYSTIYAHSVINFCIFNCFMFPIFTRRNLKDFFTVYTFMLCRIMKLHNSPKEQKLFIFKNIYIYIYIYIGEGFLGSY